MIVPCDCCGSFTDCEKCDDPAVAAEMHRLLWETDESPMDHHIHLCGPCEEAGCNFDEPNGLGEHCS